MYRKRALSNPNSAFKRAKPDERIFVLLGRDAAAPATIRHWAAERIHLEKNAAGDDQIREALEIADEMERDQAQETRGATNSTGAQGTSGLDVGLE